MEFKLNSEQFRTALRAVVAGVIVLLAAQTLRLENTYWALLTVLILIQPRARATYQKGLYRLLGTILGAGSAVVLIGLFAQEPLFLFVSLAACFFPIFYLMSGKLLPYSFLMAGFTLIIVASIGLDDPSKAFSTAVYRSMEISLGVLASIFVTLWIWPQTAESSLRRTLAELRDDLRLALKVRLEQWNERAGQEEVEKLRPTLLARVEQLPILCDQVVLEGSLDGKEQQKLLRALHQWEALTLGLLEWLDSPVELVRPRTQNGEEEDLLALAGRLDRVLIRLGDDPFAAVEEDRAAMKEILDRLLRRLEEQREAGWNRQFAVEQNLAFYRVLDAIKAITGSLEKISLPFLRADPSSHLSAELPVWSRLPELFWADLKQPDPARLRLAIKITALFLVLLLASQASHLDFMLQSMISALLVLSQTTVGSTVHKALLRLGGAVGGGMLALAILMTFTPWMNSLAFLIVLMSLVMFLSSYISNGPPSYSYLGVQVGMAFFLTMFSGFAPPTTLDPAITRFVGVLVGSTLAILLTTSVMPAEAAVELAGHMQRLREQLGRAFGRIRRLPASAGDALAEKELNDCRKELTAAENFLLHSRIEGLLEAGKGRAEAKELDRLREIYHLLQDLNGVPAVWHRLPEDHSLTRAMEGAMDAIEARLLDPSHRDEMSSRQLSEAMMKARKEGTLVKWDAADVTAAGASMYLVGQLLAIGSPAAEMGPGFQIEPLA